MTFSEWYLKTFGLTPVDAFDRAEYRHQQTELEKQEEAYNAGVTQERERCAKIADQPWNTTSKRIAEQIRKGE